MCSIEIFNNFVVVNFIYVHVLHIRKLKAYENFSFYAICIHGHTYSQYILPHALPHGHTELNLNGWGGVLSCT